MTTTHTAPTATTTTPTDTATAPAGAAETAQLTITHTHEAGTLIDGTARGDGTAEPLKASGWRWSRNIGAWFLPQTRDRLPNSFRITRTVKALRAAGFTVATDLDWEHRDIAEVEAVKAARQEDRVSALEAKADRKAAVEDAAREAASRALGRLPEGGEPIKIGHHSEGRHRRAIDKAHTAMGRAVQAGEDTITARARADAAAYTTEARYNPVTVYNRIERLGADLRRNDRSVARLAKIAAMSPDTPGKADALAARETRLTAEGDECRDQIAYWEAVRAHKIDTGKATGHSRDTIAKGDRVKVRGTWHEVVRVNQKTVSVTTGYSWTDTTPYAEIQDHHRPTTDTPPAA